MKRIILTGMLALATGVPGLMAQQRQQGAQPAQSGQSAPAGQPGQAAPAAPAGPSMEEQQLMQTMMQSQGNPDATIKAAEELVTKFPNSIFKEAALTLEGSAYQAKQDNIKAQVTYERVLEINPKSIQANLMAGELTIQQTQEKALDREEKLARAKKYLDTTLELVKGPKPNPQMADQDWADMAKSIEAEVHNNFGMMGLLRKNYDDAVTEFQAAATADPTQPAYQARLAAAYQSAGKNAEAIAACDKLLADPQLNPQIKQFATQVRAVAMKNSQAAPKQ